MDELKTLAKLILEIPVVPIGDKDLTLGTVLYVLVVMMLFVWLTNSLTKLLVRNILSRTKIDVGVRESFTRITRYLIILLGFIVILQTAGIDLSAITVLAGAIGLGLSFGLQNITTNLASGVILLLERPIKVGDRIQVGNVTGEVIKVSLRSTIVRSDDSVAIIVPNLQFIQAKVVNWSYITSDMTFNIPVGVDAAADPKDVEKILLDVADDHHGVLDEPPPKVIFDEMDDGVLKLNLRIATEEYSSKLSDLRDEMSYAIFKQFKDSGIKVVSVK